MAHVYKTHIGNFDFDFVLETFSVEGILFNPEDEGVGNTEWQRAATVACAIWPYQKARGELDQQIGLERSLARDFDYSPSLLKRFWRLKAIVDEGIDRGYLPPDAVPASVLAIMQGERPEPQPIQAPRPPQKQRGYVYVLSSDSGLYKIGRTKDPKDRRRTFGVKMPFLVAYEIVIKVADYVALEEQLHQRFEAQRIRGEWFALTAEDIQALKNEFDNLADQFNE